MKPLALAAALVAVVLATAVGTTASAHFRAPQSASLHTISMSVMLPSLHTLRQHRVIVPLQTGATSVPATVGPTGTPGPTGTAAPTGTANTYPDPVSLLDTAIGIFGQMTGVAFEDIFTGDQSNVEHLSIDGKGVANCTPGVYAHVTGKDALLGTAQSKKLDYLFVEKKSKTWKKQNIKDKTNHQWRLVKRTAVDAFGFTIDNPLACPSSSQAGGSSGSGSSDTLKDLVNLGPETYQGVQVWHIRGTQVSTDTQGNSSEATLEFFVSRDHSLPYGYRVTINDPGHNITLTFEQRLKDFGKKQKLPSIRVGSTRP